MAPPSARRRVPAKRLSSFVAAPAVLAAAVVAVATAWVVAVHARQTTTAHVTVPVVALVVVVTAVVAGWRRQRRTTRQWLAGTGRACRQDPWKRAGMAGWSALLAAVVGWDAYSFAEQRRVLPTLSRLIGDVTIHQAGRGAVFALWLVLGAALALGGRTDRRQT